MDRGDSIILGFGELNHFREGTVRSQTPYGYIAFSDHQEIVVDSKCEDSRSANPISVSRAGSKRRFESGRKVHPEPGFPV